MIYGVVYYVIILLVDFVYRVRVLGMFLFELRE